MTSSEKSCKKSCVFLSTKALGHGSGGSQAFYGALWGSWQWTRWKDCHLDQDFFLRHGQRWNSFLESRSAPLGEHNLNFTIPGEPFPTPKNQADASLRVQINQEEKWQDKEKSRWPCRSLVYSLWWDNGRSGYCSTNGRNGESFFPAGLCQMPGSSVRRFLPEG